MVLKHYVEPSINYRFVTKIFVFGVSWLSYLSQAMMAFKKLDILYLFIFRFLSVYGLVIFVFRRPICTIEDTTYLHEFLKKGGGRISKQNRPI